MANYGLLGTLLWHHTPPIRGSFFVHCNSLQENVDLSQLEDATELCNLSHNEFQGMIDFTQLPSGLDSLWLSYNEFSGKVDL